MTLPVSEDTGAANDADLRVRFSPDIFRAQARGGVSRYITELHRELLGLGVDSKILAGLHCNSYLRGLDQTFGVDVAGLRPVPVRQAVTKVADRLLERVWTRRQDRGTIWHKSMFDRHVPTGPRLAVTVYDMIHERYPDQFGARDVIPFSKRPWCEAADVVFAISKTTREDLIERFGLPPAKVVVTYLGVTEVEPRPGPLPFGEEPWVLYVGERSKPYKNWHRALDAIAALGPEGRLVCFGPGMSASDRRAVEGRRLGDRVRFVGGDDHDLAHAYRRASTLLYPSLFEGFGLPPLEAMAHGCPVIAARAGAIPEIVSEAAILVDPTDVDALAGALAATLRGGDQVEALRRAGRRRAADFSWAQTAAATVRGYRGLRP